MRLSTEVSTRVIPSATTNGRESRYMSPTLHMAVDHMHEDVAKMPGRNLAGSSADGFEANHQRARLLSKTKTSGAANLKGGNAPIPSFGITWSARLMGAIRCSRPMSATDFSVDFVS